MKIGGPRKEAATQSLPKHSEVLLAGTGEVDRAGSILLLVALLLTTAYSLLRRRPLEAVAYAEGLDRPAPAAEPPATMALSAAVEPALDRSGAAPARTGTAVDISEFRKTEKVLRAREERYRDLVENANDLIYSIDLQGNFTSINKAAQRISGYTREEILNMNIAHLVAPEYLETARQMIQKTLRGDGSSPYELEFITKGGGRVNLEVSHRLMLCDGIPTGTHGIARDITERRKAELLERDRLRVLESIATHQPLEAILALLVDTIERQYPDLKGAVMLLRKRRLVVGAAPRLAAGYLAAVDLLRIGPAAGSCGAAAYWRQSVIVEDIAADPIWKDHRQAALDHGLRACWSFPIVSGRGAILGTLAAYQDRPARPDADQVKLLHMAAGLAAIAIEQRLLADQLAYQALHDALTGLPNRALFQERLDHALCYARRCGHMVALLYIDLDRFKLINDTLGHAAGDCLLRQVARRLKSRVRESDTLARISGDEFTVIATALKDPQDAQAVAEAILQALRVPFTVETRELFVTVSIGISMYPQDAADSNTLQRHADGAMYRAKNAGKNGFHFFAPEIGAAISERMEVENQLRRALDRRELTLFYQPQFDLSSGRMVGQEALLRWNSGKLGKVSPVRFIPIAEESALIVPIGAWVLEHACTQTRAWRDAGLTVSGMCVNVSALQFAQRDFVEMIDAVLTRSGLEPNGLELELTESLIMRDLEQAARRMHKLRELGVRISVDDFGTGYSSLAYLQHLPIDVLKIDRSFVHETEKSPAASSLVRAIVTLAHGLGITVIAEGVETEYQFRTMRHMGCDRAQGFLLGRPAPPEAAYVAARQVVALH